MAVTDASWESVYERNSVERIKRDRPPLGIRDELPALIAAGYEQMAEEDIVRLQWWGLYHDKPKIGTFMLRVKIPSGILTPAKLRAVGAVSNRYGRGDAELTTRQCIQLHWLELSALPDVFADLEAAGITSAGGCGDTVRNITGCPVSGLAADELFDSTPVVESATAEFYGNPAWANLPRKHKYSIASCADRCNAPEINCVSLVSSGRPRAASPASASSTRTFGTPVTIRFCWRVSRMSPPNDSVRSATAISWSPDASPSCTGTPMYESSGCF